MKLDDIWMAGCRAYEVSSKRVFLKLAELTYTSQHPAAIPARRYQNIYFRKAD
jgi:hypothetical protein